MWLVTSQGLDYPQLPTKLVPYLVFEYVVTFHGRIKFKGLYVDSYMRFRVEWIWV